MNLFLAYTDNNCLKKKMLNNVVLQVRTNSNWLLAGKRLPVHPKAPFPTMALELYGVAIRFGVEAARIQASRNGDCTVEGLLWKMY